MIKNYFSLAFENLKHRGLRSWLTMFGIFIGIAAVVSLISLGQGLQTAISGQFSQLAPDTLIVGNAETGFGPPGSTVVKKLNSHDVDVIKLVTGVKDVVPRLIRVAQVEFNSEAFFTYLADIPEDKTGADLVYQSMNVGMESGKLLEAGESGKVLLGNDFFQNSKERFGKELRVGSVIKIQGKEFKVGGLLGRSSSFQINAVAFLSNKDLKEIMNIEDEIDLIAVRVTDEKIAQQVAENIKKALRKDRGLKVGEEDFTVQTPVESIQAINTVLGVVNIIVIGIAILSLIIGSAGIANTMFTSVLERRKEIGTMKAVGAKNSDILWIFLIESGLLGLVGGIIGAIIGLGLAIGAANGANAALNAQLFTVNPSIPLLIGSVLFSFLIGAFSGVFPAMQASKLKPVDALRG